MIPQNSVELKQVYLSNLQFVDLSVVIKKHFKIIPINIIKIRLLKRTKGKLRHLVKSTLTQSLVELKYYSLRKFLTSIEHLFFQKCNTRLCESMRKSIKAYYFHGYSSYI